MTKLLTWLGIKNAGTMNRSALGFRSSVIGLLANLFLFGTKFLFATMTSSASLIADAFNNLSDSLSMIVLWIGNRAASIEPDDDHPQGHGRAEYLSTLAIGIVIFVLGAQLLIQTITTFQDPILMVYSTINIIVIIFAIAVKFVLYLYNRHLSKALQSLPHMATSQDSFNDVIVSSAVLVGLIAQPYTSLPIDKSLAVIIALWIVFSSFKIMNKAVAMILGTTIDESLVNEIQAHIKTFDHVLGVHEFESHDYGPSRRIATIHIEFPMSLSLSEAHRIIDQIEASVARLFNLHLLIHLDPMSTDKQLIENLRVQLSQVTSHIDSQSVISDFRVVDSCEVIDIVFTWQVASPNKKVQGKLKQQFIKDLVKKYPNYHASITVISLVP